MAWIMNDSNCIHETDDDYTRVNTIEMQTFDRIEVDLIHQISKGFIHLKITFDIDNLIKIHMDL